ncbi:MAG TPA: hypothetical protein DDW16_00905 [Clostridiales bacterium]|nr:hypothetical protein [Clostridiales bacterium]
MNGIKVAILGKVNAGKSSIFNMILGKNRAIVSSVAGTTRDIVEGELDINGVKFVLYDTAGIRDSEDEVEKIGIERSKKAIDDCDLALFVMDGSQNLTREDKEILNAIKVPLIKVCNKSDKQIVLEKSDYDLTFCALNGDNIELKNRMFSLGVGKTEDLSADLIIEQRHYLALKRALESIKKVLNQIDSEPLELIEYDVRDAWSVLGEITGQTASESIIDEIFSKFCVGK